MNPAQYHQTTDIDKSGPIQVQGIGGSSPNAGNTDDVRKIGIPGEVFVPYIRQYSHRYLALTNTASRFRPRILGSGMGGQLKFLHQSLEWHPAHLCQFDQFFQALCVLLLQLIYSLHKFGLLFIC